METLSAHVEDVVWIAVEDSSAPGHVRRTAMKIARDLGFTDYRTGEVGVAASELATNLYRHASEGTMVLRVRRGRQEAALELIAIDKGPGMTDFDRSARDGSSTAGTLGIGLGAAKRAATWFDGYSDPATGTAILTTFWSGTAPVPRPSVAAITRPMHGETVCGDAWAQRWDDGATTLILVDGLGHGELAATAARAAVRAFIEPPGGSDPAEIMQRLDRALYDTRGAAIGVTRLDFDAGTLRYSIVGNIAGWIESENGRSGLVASPGIVGSRIKKVRESTVPLPAEALVVLHSDGLTSKWNIARYPGLRYRDPHLIAATLMRDAAIRHDDASLIVARAA